MAKLVLTPPRQRLQTRGSSVHGKGVFALLDIPKGEVLIEYKGERISWKKALKRHPHDPQQPNHTFYFTLEDGRVIDAAYGGNKARWINHSCQPNCEAFEQDGRVYIRSVRAIRAGQELNYDYELDVDGRQTAQLKRDYACHCGAKSCRGTMLARRR
jgi:SET domain-containing protein